MRKPAQTPQPIPDKPYESENVMAEESARVLEEQRKTSGGLADGSDEGEMKVKNDKPYKNLSG